MTPEPLAATRRPPRRPPRLSLAVASALALLLLAVACANPLGAGEDGASAARGRERVAVEARQAVLDAFDTHQVVGGFNASHGNKDADDFLLGLVRDPELPAQVDDIAIECGNSRHQDLLDDYVAGGDVPLADVRKVWRDSSQGPVCGFSTFYEQLVPLVRRVNAGLPAGQRLRVLACDVPVDWSRVASAADLEAFGERTRVAADIVERETLARGRTALLFFGVNHLRHGLDGSATELWEAHGYAGVAHVVADHIGFGNRSPVGEDNDELEARMARWPRPSIAPVAGTWLAELDSAYFNQPAGDRGYPGVDGYLYTGPRDTLLREPLSAQATHDEDYLAVLQRRAETLGEADGPFSPWTHLRGEVEASPYLYEPATE